MMIAISRRTMLMLLSDDEWRKRLEQAPTSTQAEQVIICFCKKHGIVLHHDVVSGRLVQTNHVKGLVFETVKETRK